MSSPQEQGAEELNLAAALGSDAGVSTRGDPDVMIVPFTSAPIAAWQVSACAV